MPLPDAGDPVKSRVYQAVKGTKLDEVSDDMIDNAREAMIAEPYNEDEFRRLILLQFASNKMVASGPLPDTQKIIQTTYTSTGDDADFFKPSDDEVWMLVGGDTLGSGGTGAINWSLKDADGNLALVFQTSVNGQEPLFQNSNNNNIPSPLYITSDNWLYANITSVATSVRASISFIRVR